MHIDKLLETFRAMNHLIELDEENWPQLEDESEWNQGWVRFHDTLNNTLLGINELGISEDGQESNIGDININSGSNYCNSVNIPYSQVAKFIKNETMKSNMLENCATIKKSYL